MIIAIKKSKLDKVNRSIFKIISVSSNSEYLAEDKDNIWEMNTLLPPANLYLGRKNGEIGKKKFFKKYEKYLEKENTIVENTIFSIALSLKEKNNICFVTSDEEFEMGFVSKLADYISGRFGVDYVKNVKDVKYMINDAISNLDITKKEKKLLNKTDDLSDKQISKKNKIIKLINKELRTTFSYEGSEYFSELDKKYAIDQVALKLISMGCANMSKTGEFKDVNAENLKKTSPLVQAILTTCESDKSLKKVVKSVLESHDLSAKEKKLKKVDKVSMISLIGELYTSLSKYRNGEPLDE